MTIVYNIIVVQMLVMPGPAVLLLMKYVGSSTGHAVIGHEVLI